MIVIYGIDKQLNPVKARMSDVIHRVVMEVLGLPEEKRAHRFIPMAKEDFYAPGGRTEAYTVIEMNMMEGRTVETKRALIHRLFKAFEEHLSIAHADLEVIIKEQPAHCWGFRGMTGDEARDLNYSINV